MVLRRLRLLPIVAIVGCVATSPPTLQTSPSPQASPPMHRPVASVPAPESDGSLAAAAPPTRTVSRSRSAPSIDGPALLRQVAAHLDAGNDQAALAGLQQYVLAFPQHLTMQAHLAELYWRLGQKAEARRLLEQYLAESPPYGASAEHRVHCHTRLVELAVAEGDDYREHLHRGGGLLALAEPLQRQDPDDPQAQRLLFQAIAELKQAVARKPEDARPHLWLMQAWTFLGQSQPAREHRAKALRLAPTSDLSDAEWTLLVRD